MDNAKIQAVGIPWYRLEDYPEILATMSDAKVLPRTYSQWRMAAEQLEKRIQREGGLVVRAELQPGLFRQWCVERGLNIDAKARQLWGAEAARRATMPTQ